MSDRKIYFGNRNYMQWIACPEAGSNYGSGGFEQSGTFLHGGAYARRTFNAAKRRSLSWALHSRDALRPVRDYAEGVYGDGPYFWMDPFDMDQNVLPQSFATPSLGARDGIILAGSIRPDLVPTGSNDYGYPFESAVYAVTPGAYAYKQWVPVPRGYTAWIGVHGDASSTVGVTVRTKSSTSVVPVTAVNTATRFSHSFPITLDQDGVELSIEGDGSIIVAGIMVQILPAGESPEQGGFVSGQGHSGMEFDGAPEMTAYSAAMDLVGLSAQFIEVGQWR